MFEDALYRVGCIVDHIVSGNIEGFRSWLEKYGRQMGVLSTVVDACVAIRVVSN